MTKTIESSHIPDITMMPSEWHLHLRFKVHPDCEARIGQLGIDLYGPGLDSEGRPRHQEFLPWTELLVSREMITVPN